MQLLGLGLLVRAARVRRLDGADRCAEPGADHDKPVRRADHTSPFRIGRHCGAEPEPDHWNADHRSPEREPVYIRADQPALRPHPLRQPPVL